MIRPCCGGRGSRAPSVLVLAALAAVLAGGPACAQTPDTGAQSAVGEAVTPFAEAVSDDRIYWHGVLDELEGRFLGGPSPAFRWDGEAWAGTDTNRLWLKSEGFASNGTVIEGDHELLYARALSTYFDLQAGVRCDLDSLPGRGWAAIGLQGLAVNFVRLSVTAYASDGGHFAGKLLATYEVLLSQRLILEPLIELNAYTHPDRAREVASGVSDLDAGLRLRYEVSRKFAPYLGVAYERTRAAAVLNAIADRAGLWRLTLGLRAWL